MATYKTDRDRNYGFVGKFKFSYTVRFLTRDINDNNFTSAQILSSAYIIFTDENNVLLGQGTIGLRFPDESSSPNQTASEWFGESVGTVQSPNFSLIGIGVKIPFFYKLGADDKFRGIFILDVQGDLDKTKDKISDDTNEGTSGGYWYRDVSGTVEGYFFDGKPLSEFVEISEHYPLKETRVPNTCQSTNQVWSPEDLTEKTVRQWPKYTTLNWFESINPNIKSKNGIYIIHTKSNGQTSIFSKSIEYTNNLFTTVSYGIKKTAYAWQSFNPGSSYATSGYIRIGGSVAYEDYKIEPLVTPNGVVTEDSWELRSDPVIKGKIKIALYQEPSRKVTFDSQIFNWDKPYTDYLKGYIIGFDSKGVLENKNFICDNKKVVVPTFQTVETRSGKISGSQTYVSYKLEKVLIVAEFIGTGQATIRKTAPVIDFNNQQKWIFGAIDRRTAPEEFDTLISPTKFMDYPEKFVRLRCGCQDINEESRFRTLDFDEDFFGCAPIPLKGWKFNAMTLKQDQTFSIPGETNSRTFTGDAQNPKYYGDLNLSGFRYLRIKARSKNNDNQSANLQIFEIAKGPKQNENSSVENEKSFLIKTSSNNYTTSIVDLCNPDNKIDFVDNQDSPYPRLNTYTTSVPTESFNLGFLSVENKPKDDFLITKPSLDTESDNWITDKIKKSISNSGFIYISNDSDSTIDYFEVDTKRFPKAGVGTNIIYGRPRIINGKIKLAKYWNPNERGNDPDFRKTLYLYVPKNDLTKDKTIYTLLNQSKDKTFPDEFEIFDYAYNFPDITDVVAKVTTKFTDGNNTIFITNISAYDKNQDLPYDAIQVENAQGVSKKYKIFDYVNSVDFSSAYFTLQTTGQFDQNLVFDVNSTIKLTFFDQTTDDTFNSVVVKFASVERFNDVYRATLEYAKYDKNSEPDFDGIPLKTTDGRDNIFSNNAPVITVNPIRLNEYTFPKDSLLRTRISPENTGNEVTAIDDYPEDEIQNGPYYGISRVTKINLENPLMELGDIELVRQNSLANFVIAGNQNTFEAKTKFTVSENANTSGVPTETQYYTRRFWQQNTDGKDEEEGDITWQFTSSATLSSWSLFPKTISDLCDDINKIDYYVAPRWLNPNNPYSEIIRHPGWIAEKVDKSYPTDPITGDRIYGNLLDPDYLNSDSGYASWLYGGGVLAVPSGKNTGSGTSYVTAIDVNFNNLKNILAQTVFHRINADFPPGKPDLFGNSSLRNEDGTTEESTLHLRGGMIARGPGHGLILPPQKSTPENLRKANLIEAPTGNNVGSSESDDDGYFETDTPYGKNKIDHYIQLEESQSFTDPARFKSTNRKMAQAKRERASFKGGKSFATDVTACESGFENSLVIGYTVPSTKEGSVQYTSIIQLDSFYSNVFENYCVGYPDVTAGNGISLQGKYPFLLSSELLFNSRQVHTFLFTEKSEVEKSLSTNNYVSLIASNTDMRNKESWFPFVYGESKSDANFSTQSKAFAKTKLNSYSISEDSPLLASVGYADDGAIIFRTIPLNTTGPSTPLNDKNLFIGGKAPTFINEFRLLDTIITDGTPAAEIHPTVSVLSSQEYYVSYVLKENTRTINGKFISNFQPSEKFEIINLDILAGQKLSADSDIFGLTSSYDKKLEVQRNVFYCNGLLLYFENPVSSSPNGSSRIPKIHLVAGNINSDFATNLIQRNNLITYYDANSELNEAVIKHKPAIVSCKNEAYKSSVCVVYDTGKCKLRAVLFNPFETTFNSSSGTASTFRDFDIECISSVDDTTDVNSRKPQAQFSASPLSGITDLNVTFIDESFDFTGSELTYEWDFGDGTTSIEKNPSHVFVNSTNADKVFTVSLVVTNGSNVKSDPFTIKITVFPKVTDLKPTARFTASPTTGPATLNVNFVNLSKPVNDGSSISFYSWDFYGDGNITTLFDNQDIRVDYTIPGTYKPTLIVEDNFSRKSDKFIGPDIVVSDKPKADFSWKQTSFGPVFGVTFTDKSLPVNTIKSWSWDFGDSQSSTSQNPLHFYNLPGLYEVTLTVTNNLNLTDTKSYQVEVKGQGNNSPSASFTYTQTDRTFQINFRDTSTDTDGQIVSWKWYFDLNDLTKVSDLQNPIYVYPSSGTYNVKLEVTDNSGSVSAVTQPVTVSPVINQPPVINFVSGVQTSFNPIVVKFTESSSDPDGFIEKWDWDFGDSSEIFSTTSSASKNPSHQYANPGVYDVTLTVTDNGLADGTNKKTAQKTITVEVFGPPANKPPQASFTVDNNNNFAPLIVNFTDSSTDSDGFIVKWLWEFETNVFQEFNVQTYRRVVQYRFTKSGTYTVKLTVTDNNGLTNTATYDIVVNNSSPKSIFTISPNPINSKEFTTLNALSSTDTDGSIVSYNWNFGDSEILSNGPAVVNKTYNRPGSYTISLEVVDNQGATNSSQGILVVRNRKPTAVIEYTSLTVKAPGTLSFSGASSFDEDGNIVSYAWTVTNGQTSNVVNPSFQFSSEGIYVVTLKVTDDFGDTGTSSVTVNVTPADNILPNAILLVDRNIGVINNLFIFDVSQSNDPDGFITLYELDFGDGNNTSFVNPSSINHIYTRTGVFNAKLVVTDNRSGRSAESIQIISIINQPPKANFSFNPANPQTLETINFVDSSTDPENDIKTWEWNFGDGNTFVTSDITQKSPQYQYLTGNKTYKVSLTVYDRFDLSNSISKDIFVSNRIPVAVISTNPVDVNKVITGSAPFTIAFDSLSYDLDGQVTDYEWTITGLVSTPITTKSFTYTFNTPRFIPYTVSHRVRDNDGFLSNVVTVAVKINPPNEPPVARITANPASNTSFAPVDVTFSGAGSYDPDNIGGPLAYYWDLGNGQTSFEQVAVTRYTQPGTYNVSLKVIDNQDGFNTAFLSYIVRNNKPIAVLNTVPPDITQVEINTSVAFTSNGSNDPDINQFVNGYKWLVDGVNLNLSTPDISYVFTSVGNHTVTLSVFDNFGLESDPVSKTIFVVRTPPPPPPNKNPIAVISNEPGVTGNIELKLGDIFIFDGTQSYDPEDGSNITFEWYIDGVFVGTSSQLSYTFNTVGLFDVSLIVTDTQNLKSSALTNLGRRLSVPVNVSPIPKADANKLFTTGQAINGAIASGAYDPNRYGYELVDNTKKYVIIEAGLKHSFFVDDLGILYGSGDNTYGQLGLPNNISKVNVLTKIPLNSKFKIVKVSAGDRTSAIIVEDSILNKKVLLVCGDNSSGTFGQALPRNIIFGFQSILERNLTNSAFNFSNNDGLLDVSTCQHITAFADNKKVWVAGKHNYSSTGFVNEIGFIGIDVRQNPDLFLTTPMMPFKIEVGFFDPTSPNDFVGYVTGIAFDPDNQIVWFAGKTNLRGWGYAYDISTYENRIGVLLADTDPYFNRAIYFYGFTSTNEIPAFLISPGTAAESQNFLPGDPQAETFQKVSVSNFGYLALSENNYWPWGDNSNGELGFAINYKDTLSENAKNGRFPGEISSVPDITNPTDISAGGFHSLLIASSAKPATNTFIFVRTGGYPNPEVLTVYPTEQAAQ
jgi:PKD repeat protein/alpha-tubulin suppressor-like RCC1 family protein